LRFEVCKFRAFLLHRPVLWVCFSAFEETGQFHETRYEHHDTMGHTITTVPLTSCRQRNWHSCMLIGLNKPILKIKFCIGSEVKM